MEQTNELALIIKESGLDASKANIILDKFTELTAIVNEWHERAKTIKITSIEQKAEMKQAREGRLILMRKRNSLEEFRKELKKPSIDEGRAIDKLINHFKSKIETIETYFSEQEKFEERLIAEQRAKIKAQRDLEVQPYLEFIPINFDLSLMPEDDYNKLLNGAKLQLEAQAKAKQEEQERIAKEQAEILKRKALREERMVKLSPCMSFVNLNNLVVEDLSEAEFTLMLNVAVDKKSNWEQEQERVKAENEKLKAEAEVRIQAQKEAEAKAKIEAKRVAELQAELQAKKDAEIKAQQELEAKRIAEEKAQKLADKKAKAMPDKKKLSQLIVTINGVVIPELKTEEAQKIAEQVKVLLNKVTTFITDKTNEL